MPAPLEAILKLEVPVIVQIGERLMHMGEIISLAPGSIVELTKRADAELELVVNNKAIGTGTAVKVGENFGLRVAFVGNLASRPPGTPGTPGTAAPGTAAPGTAAPGTAANAARGHGVSGGPGHAANEDELAQLTEPMPKQR